MQETEFSFADMLFSALRKWRKAVVFAIVCAILVGAFAAVSSPNAPGKAPNHIHTTLRWGMCRLIETTAAEVASRYA